MWLQKLTFTKIIEVVVFRYVYTSVADKDRHSMFIHGSKEPKKTTAATAIRQNICPVCKCLFPTRYQLTKHQKQEGHLLGRGRPQKKV